MGSKTTKCVNQHFDDADITEAGCNNFFGCVKRSEFSGLRIHDMGLKWTAYSTYKKLTENEIKNYRKSIEKYRLVKNFPQHSSIYGAIEQKNLQLKIQKFKNEWKNGKVFCFENPIYPHRKLFIYINSNPSETEDYVNVQGRA